MMEATHKFSQMWRKVITVPVAKELLMFLLMMILNPKAWWNGRREVRAKVQVKLAEVEIKGRSIPSTENWRYASYYSFFFINRIIFLYSVAVVTLAAVKTLPVSAVCCFINCVYIGNILTLMWMLHICNLEWNLCASFVMLCGYTVKTWYSAPQYCSTLRIHESLWTEFPCCTVFWLTA